MTHREIHIGDVLEQRFRVERLLARSRMSLVYEATDVELGRPVVYKTLPHELPDPNRDKGRFLKATNSHLAIRHPNVVPILDTGTSDETGRPYLVTSYLRGGSLRQRLKRAGRLSLDEAVDVGLQMLAGLHAAHSHSETLLHCDIKPENVLFDDGGEAVLIDFGIARAMADPASTMPEEMFGTPGYMPPEAMGDTPALTTRSDVFSFGVVFYEMLTGRLPFAGTKHSEVHPRIVAQSYEPASSLGEGVDAGVDGLVRSMLHCDPQRRPGTVAEIAADLERLTSVKRQCPLARAPRVPKRGRAVAGVLGSYPVLALAGVSTILCGLCLGFARDVLPVRLLLPVTACCAALATTSVLTRRRLTETGARRGR